jgi:hypothetical protein
VHAARRDAVDERKRHRTSGIGASMEGKDKGERWRSKKHKYTIENKGPQEARTVSV